MTKEQKINKAKELKKQIKEACQKGELPMIIEVPPGVDKSNPVERNNINAKRTK